MKLKIFFALILGFTGLYTQAQTDEPQNDAIPETQFEQFDQISKLFQGFDFGDMGGNMMMDTMIFRQFGGGDFDSVELDQMMEQMMEMVQSQMSQFDFGTLPLDQMLEELDLDSMQLEEFEHGQGDPSDQQDGEKIKRKKKLKTYKL